MEKVVKSNDKDLMRSAMLKHEEIFRGQVYELHRLYRVQKMLMNNITTVQNDPRNQDRGSDVVGQTRAASFVIGNQRLQERRNTKDQVSRRALDHNQIDESEIELTLSLGPTRPKPDKSESGQSTVSSSSTGSSQTRKISPNYIRSSTRDFIWDTSTTATANNNNNRFHEGSESLDPPGFSNGQKNNPPWTCQALSLRLS